MRSRIQAQVFLGLFLIFFGLFAAQVKKKPHLVEVKSSNPLLIEPAPESLSQTRIQILYDRVTREKIFSNKISGIKVSPTRGLLKNDFTVTLSGEEVYSDQGFTIHQSWESTLDQLAEFMKREVGIHVEIAGFADLEKISEKKPNDYPSALAFSFARAEWLAHYYENKHGIIISKTFILKGMGAVPQGKKVELRFYYGT